MHLLQHNDTVRCPHCNAVQDDGLVQDFVVPGRTPERSRSITECNSCYKEFSAEVTAQGEYAVKPC